MSDNGNPDAFPLRCTNCAADVSPDDAFTAGDGRKMHRQPAPKRGLGIGAVCGPLAEWFIYHVFAWGPNGPMRRVMKSRRPLEDSVQTAAEALAAWEGHPARIPLMLTFTVYGVPAPKGSTKAYYIAKLGRAVTTADNRRSAPWTEAVVAAARDALAGAAPFDGPVGLAVSFYLPRPKTAPRRVTKPTKKPDLDKLLRCISDGLTRAGVFHDDAQVVATIAEKNFAGGPDDRLREAGIPRVDVRVFVLRGDRLPVLEQPFEAAGHAG